MREFNWGCWRHVEVDRHRHAETYRFSHTHTQRDVCSTQIMLNKSYVCMDAFMCTIWICWVIINMSLFDYKIMDLFYFYVFILLSSIFILYVLFATTYMCNKICYFYIKTIFRLISNLYHSFYWIILPLGLVVWFADILSVQHFIYFLRKIISKKNRELLTSTAIYDWIDTRTTT